MTTIDSDKRFRYLSWNLALKFEVISSFSFSSSQIIGDTTWLTPTFGLLLESEKDGDNEDDEVDGEYRSVRGRVFAL